MVRLAWRMVTQRPASIAAAALALWIAVGVVTMCGAMLESGIRYHGDLARYAGTPVLVATTGLTTATGSGEDFEQETVPLAERGRLPGGLRDRIAGLPGVRAAVSDVAVPTVLDGRQAVELHPWPAAVLAPFTLTAGGAPAAGQVVVDARLGLRPGQRVSLDLADGVRTYTVAGTAASAAPTAPSVFGVDAEVMALAGGRPQVVGVFGDAGVRARIDQILPDRKGGADGAYARTFVGAGRGSVETPAVDNGREFAIAVSAAFGGCALLIAGLVIAGAVRLSVQQRHRDIALLRAIAATPRQVRRMVVRETALMGVVAAAAGVWPGLLATHWLRDQFVARGMVPASFRVHTSGLPALIAVAAGLLIAVGAAWAASMRPSRVRPSQALAEAAVERRGTGAVRGLLGLVALAGGVTLCIVSAHVSGDAAAGVSVGTVFSLVLATTLLGPVLIRASAALAGRLLAVAGPTGRLAAATTASSAGRLAGVLSAVVLAVGLGGSLWFVQTSQQHVAAGQVRAGLLADYVVTSPGLQPHEVAAIRGTPGVRAATGVLRGTMFTANAGGTSYPAQGVDTDGLRATMDLGVVEGNIADLRGQAIAVDTLTAAARHLHPGSRFRGWFGDGTPADLAVVAVYRRGIGFAQLTLPRDLLAQHSDSLASAVLVSVDPASADALRGRLPAGAALLPRGAYQVGLDAALVQNAWTNQVITAVLVAYAVIAAANTLVMYALGRRREFAVLRLAGTTRRQVLRVVRLEQALLLGLALAVGTAVAAATLIPMVKGTTGSATPYVPLAGWLAVLGGVVALGVFATGLPARRALRMRPVSAIGLRE